MQFGLQAKVCEDLDLAVRGLRPRDAAGVQQDRPMGGIWPKFSRKASAGAALRPGASVIPAAAHQQALPLVAYERTSCRRWIGDGGRVRLRGAGGQEAQQE